MNGGCWHVKQDVSSYECHDQSRAEQNQTKTFKIVSTIKDEWALRRISDPLTVSHREEAYAPPIEKAHTSSQWKYVYY